MAAIWFPSAAVEILIAAGKAGSEMQELRAPFTFREDTEANRHCLTRVSKDAPFIYVWFSVCTSTAKEAAEKKASLLSLFAAKTPPSWVRTCEHAARRNSLQRLPSIVYVYGEVSGASVF